MNLKDDGLVVLAEVVREDIGVHEGLSALTQDIDSFMQKLHLDPRHVQLLHLRHLLTHCLVQLHTHTHNRFTALLEYVRDHPGEQVSER